MPQPPAEEAEEEEAGELWHFTTQGCQEAAHKDLSVPDDTFSLVNTNAGLMLQSVGASVTSYKAIKDEQLTYLQWSEAKDGLTDYMRKSRWKKCEIEELAMFFFGWTDT